MFELTSRKALSRWLPGTRVAVNPGGRQRASGLPDLPGLRVSSLQALYRGEELEIKLEHSVYALDSTTIDLCLSLFPWATFRKTKGAIKLHTLLDLRGSIPTFISLTPGNVHDVNLLDTVPLQKESIVALDRGYTDFRRLYAVHCQPAFFVIPAKSNLRCRRLSSRPVKKPVRADQTIILTGTRAREDDPEALRRVSYVEPETKKRLVFLTNIFTIPAQTVADIFKLRWQIELFFRWIKQHLRIKSFYGTSATAVKTQIWAPLRIYLLVAIMKKRLNLSGSLHTLLQILEVNIFERKLIQQPSGFIQSLTGQYWFRISLLLTESVNSQTINSFRPRSILSDVVLHWS
jgi:hypothetical protein